MRIRIPIAVLLAPIGLVIGAILVGRPVAVDDDLVIDPAQVTVVSTSTVAPPPVATTAAPATTTTASTTTLAPTTDTVQP